MNEWSVFFHHVLQLVTHYLSRPEADEDSTQLKALKRVYPRYFLSNLLLMSLIQRSSSISIDVKERCISWYNQYCLEERSMLSALFSLTPAELTEDQRSEILAAMRDKEVRAVDIGLFKPPSNLQPNSPNQDSFPPSSDYKP